jgi:hypothetical protein
MSVFSSDAKETMLNALTPDRARMHSGDPGTNGTDGALGSLTVCSFGSASGGVRALSTNVDFTGLGTDQTCPWFSVWDNNDGTPVFLGKGAITSGDTQANAAGEFSLTTGTQLLLNDP